MKEITANKSMLKQNECSLIRQMTANVLMEHYAQANCISVPQGRKSSFNKEQTALDNIYNAPKEHMMASLTIQELEKALVSLKKNKSPGKDEMLIGLGKTA